MNINKKIIGVTFLSVIAIITIIWISAPFVFCVEKGKEIPSDGIFTFLKLKCCGDLTKKASSKLASENAKKAGWGECMHPMCECSICIPCGNGICDKDENKCNCPEDCNNKE